LMQFPIAARFGVEVVHFGTSTGVARLDTLSIGTPLTTEVFENRQTAGGLEFAWPTPPAAAAAGACRYSTRQSVGRRTGREPIRALARLHPAA